eukprot:g78112.t1
MFERYGKNILPPFQIWNWHLHQWRSRVNAFFLATITSKNICFPPYRSVEQSWNWLVFRAFARNEAAVMECDGVWSETGDLEIHNSCEVWVPWLMLVAACQIVLGLFNLFALWYSARDRVLDKSILLRKQVLFSDYLWVAVFSLTAIITGLTRLLTRWRVLEEHLFLNVMLVLNSAAAWLALALLMCKDLEVALRVPIHHHHQRKHAHASLPKMSTNSSHSTWWRPHGFDFSKHLSPPPTPRGNAQQAIVRELSPAFFRLRAALMILEPLLSVLALLGPHWTADLPRALTFFAVQLVQGAPVMVGFLFAVPRVDSIVQQQLSIKHQPALIHNHYLQLRHKLRHVLMATVVLGGSSLVLCLVLCLSSNALWSLEYGAFNYLLLLGSPHLLHMSRPTPAVPTHMTARLVVVYCGWRPRLNSAETPAAPRNNRQVMGTPRTSQG